MANDVWDGVRRPVGRNCTESGHDERNCRKAAAGNNHTTPKTAATPSTTPTTQSIATMGLGVIYGDAKEEMTDWEMTVKADPLETIAEEPWDSDPDSEGPMDVNDTKAAPPQPAGSGR